MLYTHTEPIIYLHFADFWLGRMLINPESVTYESSEGDRHCDINKVEYGFS